MLQAKFSVEEEQIHFLNNYEAYGFKDKSAMVRAAIGHFRKDFERRELMESAELYREVYKENQALRDLTETATAGWPE